MFLTVCDLKLSMKMEIKLSFIHLIFATLIKNTNDLLLVVNLLSFFIDFPFFILRGVVGNIKGAKE